MADVEQGYSNCWWRSWWLCSAIRASELGQKVTLIDKENQV